MSRVHRVNVGSWSASFFVACWGGAALNVATSGAWVSSVILAGGSLFTGLYILLSQQRRDRFGAEGMFRVVLPVVLALSALAGWLYWISESPTAANWTMLAAVAVVLSSTIYTIFRPSDASSEEVSEVTN